MNPTLTPSRFYLQAVALTQPHRFEHGDELIACACEDCRRICLVPRRFRSSLPVRCTDCARQDTGPSVRLTP